MKGVIACYTQCWSCMFGQHYDPPRMHGWANDEDREHAERTGQPEPTGACNCHCVSYKAWGRAHGRRHPRLTQIHTAYRRRRRGAAL